MTEILNYFATNHDHLLYSLAGLCLVLELAVLGMSGPLLFLALGCALTGILVSLGWVSGWQWIVAVVAVFTALFTAILWRPFKRFQNEAIAADTSSDMIGRQLPVTQRVTAAAGRVAYSGIEWPCRLLHAADQDIAEQSLATVKAVDGAVLLVQASANQS